MTLLILTSLERELLADIVRIHIDGLVVAKDLTMNDLDDEGMLGAVAAVDEAIVVSGKLLKRIENAS